MKSSADDLMRRGFRRMAETERKSSFRSIISRAKHLESMDWAQLPIISSESLTDEDGVFWFIPGFSIIGDGDRVKP